MRRMPLRIERSMRVYDLQYFMGFFVFSSSEHEERPGKNSEKDLKVEEKNTLGKTMQETAGKTFQKGRKDVLGVFMVVYVNVEWMNNDEHVHLMCTCIKVLWSEPSGIL